MEATRWFYIAALLCALAWHSARAIGVATCQELVDVDRATETKITITTADLACDEFTRLSIRSEALVLGSKVGKVTFSNVSFHVFGSLTVEPDVEFTGIKLVVR